MNINSRLSWRTLGHLLLMGSIGAILIMACDDHKNEPVAGSQVPDAEYRELMKKATAGDPSAQLGLSLVLDGTEEGMRWLEKAAASNYPPAVDALARQYMLRDEKHRIKARKMLDQIAGDGYYPAIVELATCEDEGRCGKRDLAGALTWSILSRQLAESEIVEKHLLAELEAKLRSELESHDVARAETTASALAKRIGAMPKPGN